MQQQLPLKGAEQATLFDGCKLNRHASNQIHRRSGVRYHDRLHPMRSRETANRNKMIGEHTYIGKNESSTLGATYFTAARNAEMYVTKINRRNRRVRSITRRRGGR